jgi:hypothetical protein
MPRFFFDIDDGDRTYRDDEGLNFSNAKSARDNAVSALPDIARDAMPDEERRDFMVTMRDESGKPIFRASLTLRTEWLGIGQ